MLSKSFQPQEVETQIYESWETSGAFQHGQNSDGDPYCIVIPPPNVTGSLHMGHALNNTLQDILVRFERMRGRDVLWQVGMDHAGIATQMVVERQLQSENQTERRTMGREAFVDRVWQWKEESGGEITKQLRRLGASCDWRRERFTMDEGLSLAVLKVFIQLYREDLIYKDKRLVNWDPKFLTAISDLEVVNKDVQGHLWHFKYPIEGEEGRTLIVATTRPETMLGDTAVAVHPEDERYKDLIGKHVILPLVGRRIPIVADEYADPETGSGAVKITPAHDFNDFEVGRRHDLEMINIFDESAHLNDEVPEAYRGMERFEARARIVQDLDDLGLLDQIEDHEHTIPYGDRSDVVVEPYLTDQWYVKADVLAKPAIEAVESGKTKFVPKNWEKTYFEWMRNIQPWCISRQLWWGHQIPAWYGPDGEIFVEENEEAAQASADAHYGKKSEITRDEDVLDTWFSSALWPFSTLGWPDETAEVEHFYPTNVLVTGFDIIFFWVARMMMMGLHFMKEVPFPEVYVHALIRDEHGAKMSKSKGNVIDPLDLVDEFGADALRFTLAAMAAQGRDIQLAKSRIEGYRNFGTKLWNASRFAEMNECIRVESFDPASCKEPLNQWIVSEMQKAIEGVVTGIETYKFNDAAGAAYHFTWHVMCDWYVELIKPLLYADDGPAKSETRACMAWIIDETLKLLHPFMPFITEELWKSLAENGPARDSQLILASWSVVDDSLKNEAVDAEMEWVIKLITEIRSVRSELNVPAGAKIPALLKGLSADNAARLGRHIEVIKRLARLETLKQTDKVPEGAIQSVIDEATIVLALADVIDVDQEVARLQKELGKIEGEIKKYDAKLSNEKFLSKAPDKVIEEQKTRKTEAEAKQAKLADAMARLQGAA